MRNSQPQTSRLLPVIGGAAAVTLLLALAPTGAASAAVGPAAPSGLLAACSPGSFYANNDQINDLAVGVPGENIGKKKSGKNAGTVTLAYGKDKYHPYGTGSRILKQEDFGQKSERRDRFGAAVLVADVNGDNCGDLIVGIPGENKGKGRVAIMFGSPTGLSGHQFLDQDKKGVPGKANKHDAFGAALAVSGAGGGALWVARPGEDAGKAANAGALTKFPFATGGGKLNTELAKNVNADTADVPGSPQQGARFGSELLGTDSKLYVGVPHQRVEGKRSAGAVFTLGSSWSMVAQGNGARGKLEKGDRFGAALSTVSCPGASGDVLAVGSPGENLGKTKDAGTVTVIADGSSTVITQGLGPVPNQPEKGDLFGRSLAGYGRSLAIGSPEENYKGKKNAGFVTTLTLNCSAEPVVVDAANIKPRRANDGDRFGRVLNFGIVQTDAPTHPMLLVGSPQEAGAGGLDSGTVAVFDDPEEDNLFTRDIGLLSQTNLKGKSEDFDFFGSAIGAAS